MMSEENIQLFFYKVQKHMKQKMHYLGIQYTSEKNTQSE